MIFISNPSLQTPPHLHTAPRQSLRYRLGPNRTAAQTSRPCAGRYTGLPHRYPVRVRQVYKISAHTPCPCAARTHDFRTDTVSVCSTYTRFPHRHRVRVQHVHKISAQTPCPYAVGIQDCRTDIPSMYGRYTGLPHRHPVHVRQVYRIATQTSRPCTSGIQDFRTDTFSVCQQVYRIAAQTPRPRVQVYKVHPAGPADFRPVSDLLTRGKRRVKIIITRSLPRGGRHTRLNDWLQERHADAPRYVCLHRTASTGLRHPFCLQEEGGAGKRCTLGV